MQGKHMRQCDYSLGIIQGALNVNHPLIPQVRPSHKKAKKVKEIFKTNKISKHIGFHPKQQNHFCGL